MKAVGIQLSWIVVANLEAAVTFYTQVMGLKLLELHKEYGWAELSGPGGSILGIAQESSYMDNKAGTNAVITIAIEGKLEDACEELKKKGTKLLGNIIEVPGHVKMQTCVDPDGNMLQVVQKL